MSDTAKPDLHRRKMLKLLGLGAATAYAAPMVIGLDQAKASSWSRPSRPSRPSRMSRPSRPSRPRRRQW